MADIKLDELQTELRTSVRACIAAADAAYRTRLEELAAHVASSHTRVVLLAGPSGSGKTTTANLLADTLSAAGHPATVVSLDDFYRPLADPDYPRTPDGALDFETPHSLRLDMVREAIGHVIRREPTPLPRYEFELGYPIDHARTIDIPEGGCAIIEGLHALNPILTEGMPVAAITRVFISVSTNIEQDGRRIISGRKIRFIRRMTRDSLYRGAGVRRNLELWAGVREGENKYLYPYRDTADYCFDTFHRYEIGVMKPWAERALALDPALDDPMITVIREALALFDPISLDDVPRSALVREFVPGGIYEHLY